LQWLDTGLEAPAPPVELINNEQRKKLWATAKDAGASEADVKEFIAETYGIDSTAKLTKEQAGKVIEYYVQQKQAQEATV
jgi:hypothetical protein